MTKPDHQELRRDDVQAVIEGPRRTEVGTEPPLGGRLDPRLTRILSMLIGGFVVVKATLLVLLAWNGRFVMDELGLLDNSNGLFIGYYRAFDPIKTILGELYFALGRLVTQEAVELIHFARAQGVLISVVLATLTWKICRRLHCGIQVSWFSVAILLAFTNFAERSFRIRTDTVATTLALGATLLLVRSFADRKLRHSVFAGFLLGLAFLVTQKAVFFLAAALAADVAARKSLRPGVVARQTIALMGGWTASLILYAVVFGGSDALHVVATVFLGPSQLVLKGHDFYPGIHSWISSSLRLNTIPYLLGAAGLVCGFRGLLQRSAEVRFVVVLTVCISLLVFTHSQPWPYVFVMCQPLLAVMGGYFVSLLGASNRTVVMFLLTLLLCLTVTRSIRVLEVDNLLQCAVIAEAESLLGVDDRYADGLGMVPTRRRAGLTDLWWDRMGSAEIRRAAETGDLETLQRLFAEQPKIWIFTYRMQDLWDILSPYIVDSYIPVYPNVMLIGARLQRAEETRFLNHWAGTYALFDGAGKLAPGTLLVDDREVDGEVRLEPGWHRLRIPHSSSSDQLFLLPTGVPLPGRIPAGVPPLALFDNVYY